MIGVYPMLENDSCWFLAADFDKETWMDDIAAFRKTCQSMGIPIAVERSRSGNGAHAWFFFTEIISANTARAMGCFLITETMSNRHQLSMESYDRLFPSQDTLPKGGFGNLIALPLQHEPRQKNNTVFLDENFKPYEDLALWALSFGRSHRLIIRHLEKTSDPIRASRHAVNALTVMVAGLIAVAVANEEVIAHPRGQTSFALSLLLCGGPILFLSAQGWYLWAVPSVRSQLHVIGGMVLLFVGLATLAVPPYVALLLVGASVLTIAVLAR